MVHVVRWRRLAALFGSLAVATGCDHLERLEHPLLSADLSGSNGALAVAITTSGSDIDADGYLIRVDTSSFRFAGVNDLVTFTGLSAGDHRVDLYGVAMHCWAMGYDPNVVTLTAGVLATATFDMGCGYLGSLYVATSTTGVDLDADGYTVTVDGSWSQSIATNDGVWFSGVATGTHSVALSGLAGNCALNGTNPRSVTVASGEMATVTFSVDCAPTGSGTGTLTVIASTTGSDLPAGYTATVDGTMSQPIALNDTVTFNVAAGDHPAQLSDVAPNCTVDGANQRTVTVPADGADTTTFSVTCSAPLARVAGRGQLKMGPLEPGSFVQVFELDVRADLTGWFRFTDYSDTHSDGSVGRWIVDPVADPRTYWTAYRSSSSACSDPSCGVELDAVGLEEDHQTIRIMTIELCDNGPPGTGTDFLSLLTSGKYGRSGILTSGDLVKR